MTNRSKNDMPLVKYDYTDAYGVSKSISYSPIQNYYSIVSGNSPRGPSGELLLQNNNLTHRTFRATGKVVYAYCRPPNPIYHHYSYPIFTGAPGKNLARSSDIIARCDAKFFEKAVEVGEANINLGVEALFVKQKVELAAKLILACVSPLRALKKALSYIGSDLKTPIGKSVANKWLNYKYGLGQDMQLLYDISRDGLVLPPQKQLFEIKASIREEKYGLTKTAPVNQPGSGLGCLIQTSSESEEKFTCKVKNIIVFTLKDADETLFVNNAFGLMDPMSIAWEAMPFSFVWDWFNPIGDYLAASHMLKNLEFLTGLRTIKETWTAVKKITVVKLTNASYSAPTTVRAEMLKTRTVLLTFPLLEIPSFSMRNLFSFDKLATSLALLRQTRH